MWGLLQRLQQQIKSNHSINHSVWLTSRKPGDFLFSLPSSYPLTFAPFPCFPISLEIPWFFRKLAIFLPFYLEIEKSEKKNPFSSSLHTVVTECIWVESSAIILEYFENTRLKSQDIITYWLLLTTDEVLPEEFTSRMPFESISRFLPHPKWQVFGVWVGLSSSSLTGWDEEALTCSGEPRTEVITRPNTRRNPNSLIYCLATR